MLEPVKHSCVRIIEETQDGTDYLESPWRMLMMPLCDFRTEI